MAFFRRIVTAVASIMMYSLFPKISEINDVPATSPTIQLDYTSSNTLAWDGTALYNTSENNPTGLFNYTEDGNVLLSTGTDALTTGFSRMISIIDGLEKPPIWLASALALLFCSLLCISCCYRSTIHTAAASTANFLRIPFPTTIYQAAIRGISDVERRMPLSLQAFARRSLYNYSNIGFYTDFAAPFISASESFRNTLRTLALRLLLAVVFALLWNNLPRRDQRLIDMQRENKRVEEQKEIAESRSKQAAELLEEEREKARLELDRMEKDAQRTANDLRAQLGAAETRFKEVQMRYDNREEAFNRDFLKSRQLERTRDDLKAEISEEKGRSKQLVERVTELLDQLEEQRKREDGIEKLKEKAEAELAERCTGNKRMEIKITNLEKDLDTDREQMEKWEAAEERLDEEIKELKGRNGKHLRHIKELEALVKKHETTIRNNAAEKAKPAPTANQEELAASRAEVKALQAQVDGYKGNALFVAAENETARLALEKEVEKLKGERDAALLTAKEDAASSLSATGAQIAAVEKERELAREEANTVKKLKSFVEGNLTRTKQQLTDTRTERDALSEEVKKKDAALKSAGSSTPAAEMEKEMKTLRTFINRAREVFCKEIPTIVKDVGRFVECSESTFSISKEGEKPSRDILKEVLGAYAQERKLRKQAYVAALEKAKKELLEQE